MTKAVFGLVDSEEHARRIVDRLLSAGFTNEDISILYPDHSKNGTTGVGTNGRTNALGTSPGVAGDDIRDVKRTGSNLSIEKDTKAPEGGVTGALTGGILGGSLGLLAGLGAIAIPGLGAFVAAGPIMAALAGSGIGGSLGLLTGALVGAGIPEHVAKKYEAGVKAGKILVSVHTDDSDELKNARQILESEGAKDVSSSTEKAGSY